ncbi:MAG TPA: chorismate-binding protein, partial [Pedococcus sp.]
MAEPAPGLAPDLRFGATWPSRETFEVLAKDRRVIPVVRRLMADAETPVGVYRKLARDEPGTFLLESAEHGGVWSRYSIVGAACRATLTEHDGEAVWVGQPPVGVPTGGNPVEALRDTVAALATEPVAGLPPLTGGMVGAIGYDAVRRWERVPDDNPDVLRLPELAMMLATDLAVLDHADGSLLLVANAVNYDATDERVEEAWADAVARLDRMTADLAQPAQSTVAVIDADRQAEAMAHVTSNLTQDQFEQMVEDAKEDIRAGEVFQVVLSQRFSTPCPADALDVYRALRSSNPSPY